MGGHFTSRGIPLFLIRKIPVAILRHAERSFQQVFTHTFPQFLVYFST